MLQSVQKEKKKGTHVNRVDKSTVFSSVVGLSRNQEKKTWLPVTRSARYRSRFQLNSCLKKKSDEKRGKKVNYEHWIAGQLLTYKKLRHSRREKKENTKESNHRKKKPWTTTKKKSTRPSHLETRALQPKSEHTPHGSYIDSTFFPLFAQSTPLRCRKNVLPDLLSNSMTFFFFSRLAVNKKRDGEHDGNKPHRIGAHSPSQ